MGTNQSHSEVHGDQVAGDKITTFINQPIEVVRDLAPAEETMKRYGYLDSSDINDNDDTVLIRKLNDGKCNAVFIRNAKVCKLDALGRVITFSKTEKGKEVINDIYFNLVSIINTRYISQMNDGDCLKTQLKEIMDEFTPLVLKYKALINIDEAFINGLLFIATSNCAINWRIQDENTADC